MRILDKYLLRTFLMPWLCCTLGFSFLLVIVDLVEQINDFLDAGARFVDILIYYLHFLPTIWIYIGPVTALLGMLYAFYQLTRNNEIIAMRASGISLHRILRPFLVLGVFFSLVSIHIAENVSPQSLGWIDQFLARMKDPDARILSNIRFRDPESNRSWDVSAFDLEAQVLRGLSVTQTQAIGSSRPFRVHASSAIWMDSHWFLHNGKLQPLSDDGHPFGPIEEFSVRPMIELTESPEMILRENQNFDFMTSREMREYLEKRPSATSKVRANLLTQLHIRQAHSWMCLVTMLLAAPFATQTARKGVFTGVMMCLALFFTMFFMMSLFKALGLGRAIPPWVAGWTPTLVFGFLGLHLLRKLR
jgi:lipopolysaccharide export system permease protein